MAAGSAAAIQARLFHAAARGGNIAEVTRLLDAGTNVDLADPDDVSAWPGTARGLAGAGVVVVSGMLQKCVGRGQTGAGAAA